MMKSIAGASAFTSGLAIAAKLLPRYLAEVAILSILLLNVLSAVLLQLYRLVMPSPMYLVISFSAVRINR